MTQEERKLLKHMQERERQWLRKQSATRRKAAPPRQHFDTRSMDWEDDVPEAYFRDRQHRKAEDPLTPGLVMAIGPGFCRVLCGKEERQCRMRPELAVGDRVLLARREIDRVLPRTTTLSRPDPHNPRVERMIAANIDLVVIVASARAPALRPGLIDRYLVAVERSGAEALLCINKMDLAEQEPPELEAYRGLGIRVILSSAVTGLGLDELVQALAGKLCVFVGHSGVGKSSLLNAIRPELDLATNTVSEATQKGRHTTTASTLYQIENGARIIDTPGIREFGLWRLSREELCGYFHEFDGRICGFSDCTHTHEPGCAVKKGVEAGVIPAARYQSYLRILDSLPTGPESSP